MLNLIFVEAALEPVPGSIVHHPSVRRDARRRGKDPSEVLLDRSLHHAAMKGLPKAHKRGRPDIIHFCLLEALGSPLNLEGGLRVWVHTLGGYIIEVDPQTRLPRDYNRFKGLIEQLFERGSVPPGAERPLLRLRRMELRELLEGIGATYVVALTSHGRGGSLEEVCRRLMGEENPAVFIGAYQKGELEGETLSLADDAVSIYPDVLDAWVVTSRLIYDFERLWRASSNSPPSPSASRRT
ncbi:MAG: 16S rRNA methyltransferase [Candidatus Bathyarchaeota archaeon B23]|nr:MAG: 16S rRNA methyltransferase [Candidatus Bathyarchaeota archaeon B23]